MKKMGTQVRIFEGLEGQKFEGMKKLEENKRQRTEFGVDTGKQIEG